MHPGPVLPDEPVKSHHHIYFTLPSLSTVTLEIPKKLTEADFKYLLDAINAWKPALVVNSEL